MNNLKKSSTSNTANKKSYELPLDIISKFENSNATVDELRIGIFSPIEKLSAKSTTYLNFIKNGKQRVLKSNYGTVVIKGNILTQTHRDILDCIFSGAKKIKELKGGGIAVYFSTSDVMDKYSSGKSRNTKWLKSKLDEIQTTAIEFRSNTNKEDFYSFNIISSFAYSSKHNSFGMVFTPEYRKFFENQLTINYKNELERLLKVPSPLLKAIIRFFWTHNFSNYNCLKLLEIIGFPIDSIRNRQRALKEIRDNASLLRNYGIIYEEKDKILYRKDSFNNTITFISSIRKKTKKLSQ